MNRFAKMKKERIYTLFETLSSFVTKSLPIPRRTKTVTICP